MYLATTWDRDLWDGEDDVAVLCNGAMSTINSTLDSTRRLYHVEQHPFRNAVEQKSAFEFIQRSFDHTFPILARCMNEIHSTKHSNRYWEVVCGYFFRIYLQAIYERYSMVKGAISRHSGLRTHVLLPVDYRTPRNLLEYVGWVSSSDSWNLQLASQVVRRLGGVKLVSITPGFEAEKLHVNLASGIGDGPQGWWARLTRNIVDTLNRFMPASSILMYQGYMPMSARICLWVRSGFRIQSMLPMGRDMCIPLRVNPQMRAKLAGIKTGEEFVDLVFETLAHNMPIQFLENFKELNRCVARTSYSRHVPKVLTTDTGWYFNEAFQVFAANSKESGTILLGAQHGGGYGDRLFSTSEWHERSISDRFATWGWNDGNGAACAPLPSLVLQKSLVQGRRMKRRDFHGKDGPILLVGTACARYFSSFETSPICHHFLEDYVNDQARFVNSLASAARERLIVRPYHHDYGWNVRALIQTACPGVVFDGHKGPKGFITSLTRAGIFVSDNLNTTFLQALALEIPSVLFWNPVFWASRASSMPYYDALKRVGIYHESPESAAAFISKISEDPISWWDSADVRDAKDSFVTQFARSGNQPVAEWRDFLIREAFQMKVGV